MTALKTTPQMFAFVRRDGRDPTSCHLGSSQILSHLLPSQRMTFPRSSPLPLFPIFFSPSPMTQICFFILQSSSGLRTHRPACFFWPQASSRAQQGGSVLHEGSRAQGPRAAVWEVFFLAADGCSRDSVEIARANVCSAVGFPMAMAPCDGSRSSASDSGWDCFLARLVSTRDSGMVVSHGVVIGIIVIISKHCHTRAHGRNADGRYETGCRSSPAVRSIGGSREGRIMVRRALPPPLSHSSRRDQDRCRMTRYLKLRQGTDGR